MQQSAKLIEYRPATKPAATLQSIERSYPGRLPVPIPESSNPFISIKLRGARFIVVMKQKTEGWPVPALLVRYGITGTSPGRNQNFFTLKLGFPRLRANMLLLARGVDRCIDVNLRTTHFVQEISVAIFRKDQLGIGRRTIAMRNSENGHKPAIVALHGQRSRLQRSDRIGAGWKRPSANGESKRHV